MNAQPFNFEISKLITHFQSALDDVVINRYNYDNDGKPTIAKKIKVPLKYSPKTKTLADIVSVKGQARLPIMAVQMESISIDTNRNSNKNGFHVSQNVSLRTGDYQQLLKPTPINVTLRLTIVTEYHEDFDQIITNFIAYFNPYIYISWKEPFTEKEIRSKVTWDGSVSLDFPNELQDTKPRFVGTTTFEVEGWIFKEEQINIKPILGIETNYNFLSACLCPPELGVDYSQTETKKIVGKPCIRWIEPQCIKDNSVETNFTVFGECLDNVDSIFLLDTNLSAIEVEPYCFNEDLSASCPRFRGHPIQSIQYINDNTISFNVPSGIEVETFDIRFNSTIGGCCDLSDVSGTNGCELPFSGDGISVTL